jgi:hypothetical protein
MSQTYSIACTQCKCHLWIAQSSVYTDIRVYTKKEYMDALQAFLYEHRKHPLVFDDNCESQMCYERWKEIEVTEEIKKYDRSR